MEGGRREHMAKTWDKTDGWRKNNLTKTCYWEMCRRGERETGDKLQRIKENWKRIVRESKERVDEDYGRKILMKYGVNKMLFL